MLQVYVDVTVCTAQNFVWVKIYKDRKTLETDIIWPSNNLNN